MPKRKLPALEAAFCELAGCVPVEDWSGRCSCEGSGELDAELLSERGFWLDAELEAEELFVLVDPWSLSFRLERDCARKAASQHVSCHLVPGIFLPVV